MPCVGGKGEGAGLKSINAQNHVKSVKNASENSVTYSMLRLLYGFENLMNKRMIQNIKIH